MQKENEEGRLADCGGRRKRDSRIAASLRIRQLPAKYDYSYGRAAQINATRAAWKWDNRSGRQKSAPRVEAQLPRRKPKS